MQDYVVPDSISLSISTSNPDLDPHLITASPLFALIFLFFLYKFTTLSQPI